MKHKELVWAFLAEDAYLQVNKKVARLVGLNAAVMLANLVSKDKYWQAKGGKTDNGFFYDTSNGTENDTCLSIKQSRAAINTLAKHKLIEHFVGGMPRKRHFKVEYENIYNTIVEERPMSPKRTDCGGNKKHPSVSPKGHDSESQTASLVSPKGHINNNKRIIIKKKRNYNIASAKAEAGGNEGIVNEQGKRVNGTEAIRIVLQGIQRIEEEERRMSEGNVSAVISEIEENEDDCPDDSGNDIPFRASNSEVQHFIQTYQEAHKELFGREFVMSKGHISNVRNATSDTLRTLSNKELLKSFFLWCKQDDGTTEHLYEKHSDMSPSVLLQESVLQRFIKYIKKK